MHTYQAMCWKSLMPSGSQRWFCWGRGFVPRGKVDHLMECNSITSMFDPIYRTGMSAVAWTPLSWCSVSSWGGMAGLWMLAQITQDWVDWLHTSSSMLPQYKSTWGSETGCAGQVLKYVTCVVERTKVRIALQLVCVSIVAQTGDSLETHSIRLKSGCIHQNTILKVGFVVTQTGDWLEPH